LPLFPSNESVDISGAKRGEQKEERNVSEHNAATEQGAKIKLKNVDKKEFAELFSECLLTIIQSDDPEQQSLLQNIKNIDTHSISKRIADRAAESDSASNGESIKSTEKLSDGASDGDVRGQREEKDQNEEPSATDAVLEKECNAEDDSDDVLSVLRVGRTTRKLLPVAMRGNPKKSAPRHRRQYLEPLDKVADIILNDLIDRVSGELDAFCCDVVDTLIESELSMQ